ncbi:hypothetical protein FNF28_03345 [Cafeteria roenbergensis]|uniref:JmjC domain-containing protein n=1 Tax=Cafeteria roenbergensis TaxID=33653 RepID=A0A5A8DL30_CAFRO|nr:hypothetical protein FNF28_03345 [Cafeteria roenbergensis]
MAAAPPGATGAGTPSAVAPAGDWTWQDAQGHLLSGPEIPRLDVRDDRVLEFIRKRLPMVITGSSLIEPVRRRWTLDYLAKHAQGVQFTVRFSSGSFRYADEDKNESGFDHADPMHSRTLPMAGFAAEMHAHCALDGGRVPFAGSSEEPSPVDPSTAAAALTAAGLAPSPSEWRSRMAGTPAGFASPATATDAMLSSMAEDAAAARFIWRRLGGVGSLAHPGSEASTPMSDEEEDSDTNGGASEAVGDNPADDGSDGDRRHHSADAAAAAAGAGPAQAEVAHDAGEKGDVGGGAAGAAVGAARLAAGRGPSATSAGTGAAALAGRLAAAPAAGRCLRAPGALPVERVYLQQALCDGVGQPMIRDFRGLDWALVSRLQSEGQWGALTTNLLLIAQRGAVTPLHYDEQHNLLCQARGRKLVLLGGPEQWQSFYPFPVGHPCDRQSQVCPRDPDLWRFPLWRRSCLSHTVLQPGDVLFIPAYWWHHVESPWEDSVSVNFWHRCSAAVDMPLPLAPDSPDRLILCRNLERLLMRTLGPCRAVDLLFRLQAGLPLGEVEQRARQDALLLLSKVLAPGEGQEFLLALVAGRFDLPRRAATTTAFHVAATQRAVLCGLVAAAMGKDLGHPRMRAAVSTGDIVAVARLCGWKR